MKTLVIFLVLSVWIVQTTADKKNCFCKVVDADNNGNVIENFGSVEQHSSWLHVTCARLHGCSDKCATRVNEWLCKPDCMSKTQGRKVRHYYQASVCGEGAGAVSRSCGCL